jgi:CubicO group peptidase (beta-lactamase class C family)
LVTRNINFLSEERTHSNEWTEIGLTFRPNLSEFDLFMKSIMQFFNIKGGTLAITKQGKLIFAKGYTWAEPKYPKTTPESLFRIASCTKPLTSIAIFQLYKKGLIDVHDLICEKLDLGLRLDRVKDKRFKEIRISHLLSHSGGWEETDIGKETVSRKQMPFDPMFSDRKISRALKSELPIKKEQIIEFMVTKKKLQFDPGTDSKYSNFGFSLLGQIIKENNMGQQSFCEYLSSNMSIPLRLNGPYLAKSRLKDKRKNEVYYHSYKPRTCKSVFSDSERVPENYGGYNIENMDSHGGLLMSCVDYAKVLAAFDFDNNPLLDKEFTKMMWKANNHNPRILNGWFTKKVKDSNNKPVDMFYHTGFMRGSNSLVAHRSDGLSFVLFLNYGYPDESYIKNHRDSLNTIASKIQKWPSDDLFPIYEKSIK